MNTVIAVGALGLLTLIAVMIIGMRKERRKLRKLHEEMEQNAWQTGYDVGFAGGYYRNPYHPADSLYREYMDGWREGNSAYSMDAEF